jgi:hypothetical protein
MKIGKSTFTPTVAQRAFWYEQQRVAKLKDKNPVLKSLAD